MTEHLLLRIAWRPDGWFGGVCADPLNNTACEKFESIKTQKQRKGICTSDSFYCGDEHAAFSEWWVRTHSAKEPRRLEEGRSLVFLLSHNPRKGDNLYYVGFYTLKELRHDENRKRCILVAEPTKSTFFDPDLVALKEIKQWGQGFRYVSDDTAKALLQRAFEAHQIKIRDILDPKEKSEWESVVNKIGEALKALRIDEGRGIDELRVHFAARGLRFTPHQLATFATALQTKGFVILSGISGTGKTRLAQHFAALMLNPEAQMAEQPETTTQPSNLPTSQPPNYLFIPVRPDWRDSKSLLGYYNPLTEQFESTEFLRFILQAKIHYDEHGIDALPRFVILDEMNLARVEYYFADFLSVLESDRWMQQDADEGRCSSEQVGYAKEPVRFQYPPNATGNLPPQELYLPPNLYFVGTVNVDETTHAFSPKVLDRAFTIELTEADFSDYPPQLDADSPQLSGAQREALGRAFTRRGQFAVVDKDTVGEFVAAHPQYRAHLQNLSEHLRPYDLHFAYRIFDEIAAFCANAASASWFDGFGDLDDVFDTAVLMKILPKFHGSRGRLLEPLHRVLAWAQQPDNPMGALSAVKEHLKDADTCLCLRLELDSQLGVPNLPTFQHSNLPPFIYPRTARKTARMLRELYDTGFASFS